MRRVGVLLAWLGVSATVIGFFLPWARIDLREPGLARQLHQTLQEQGVVDKLMQKLGRVAVTVRRGTETITGDLPTLADIPKQVSGFRIPQMANAQHAQVAMALFELLTQKRQSIGVKSYAVYLLPGLALLCGVLLTVLGNRAPVALGLSLLCAAVAGAGFWKLLTTNTKTLFIAITIGEGLWLSLWGYVGLALSGLLCGVLPRKRS